MCVLYTCIVYSAIFSYIRMIDGYPFWGYPIFPDKTHLALAVHSTFAGASTTLRRCCGTPFVGRSVGRLKSVHGQLDSIDALLGI